MIKFLMLFSILINNYQEAPRCTTNCIKNMDSSSVKLKSISNKQEQILSSINKKNATKKSIKKSVKQPYQNQQQCK
jgi:hypothetical protein